MTKVERLRVICGDWVEGLRGIGDGVVDCCVTSPPYWGLRDYGVAGQLGLEKTPEEYVAKVVAGFREVRRVLRDDGTLWVNLGDCYNGSGNPSGCRTKRCDGGQETVHVNSDNLAFRGKGIDVGGLKPKDLCGIPWRVALALQADGWYLRSDIIWHKPNPMPESVTDRPTKSHEYLFLLSKQQRYYYDAEAIKEPSTYPDGMNGKQPVKSPHGQGFAAGRSNGSNDGTRNKRTVWTVATAPYSEAHFATFPPDLIKPCILAGCPVGGTVLDPFFGSGTTGQVALELGRNCIGIELNPAYVKLAGHRTDVTPGLNLG